MSLSRLHILATAALEGLAILALAGCIQTESKNAETTAERPVLVTTAHYVPRNSPRDFVAIIRPRIESDLSFRVAGKVVHRFVDVGQNVKKGDQLGRLDDTDFKLQHEQAEAEVTAARASLDLAAANEKRGSELRRAGWQAQASYERVTNAVAEARSRLTRAERARELARNALDYSILIAEADGIVTAAPIEPGQIVVPGHVAMRVAQLDQKEAVVAVPENLLDEIKNGEAALTLWSDPSKRYLAQLRELAPISDATTRTYAARFSLPTADANVILGKSATLTLTGPSHMKVAQLPLTALLNRGHGPCLWTVDETGRLKLIPVEVQSYDSTSVYIASGAPEGMRVVTLGVQKLDEGQTVRVVSKLSFWEP